MNQKFIRPCAIGPKIELAIRVDRSPIAVPDAARRLLNKERTHESIKRGGRFVCREGRSTSNRHSNCSNHSFDCIMND